MAEGSNGMIKTCNHCGGLYTTEHPESFAEMPCCCLSPAKDGAPLMNRIKELIDYAKGASPDPYVVLRQAREIAAEWGSDRPLKGATE